VHLTSSDEQDIGGDFRWNKEDIAAQRGPDVATASLTATLSKANISSTDHVDEGWVQPGEETWILDLTPFVGDRAMATLALMGTSDSKHGLLRHMFTGPSYKRIRHNVTFSLARVANEVAAQWINRSRVLYDTVQDSRGQLTKVAKHPLDSIPAPDESVLKEVPGAYEAWKGLSSLEFRVCTVRGPKIIIHQRKLAAFQHAPLSISEEVGRLEQEHRQYEDLLAFLSTASMPNETEEDPRPDVATGTEEAGTGAPPTEYAKFESIGALHARASWPTRATCHRR